MVTLLFIMGTFLTLGFPLHLILGLINPKLAFLNKYQKATRFKSILLSVSLLILGIIFGVGAVSITPNVVKVKQVEQKEIVDSHSLLRNEDTNAENNVGQEKMTSEERLKAKEDQQKAEAEEQAVAKEIQRQIDTYGMTTEEFGEACETLITINSGSNDFGFWDMTGIEEIAGSLFMQRSVYGENAFGAKVEQRYKCWSEGGGVEIEQIGVEFH